MSAFLLNPQTADYAHFDEETRRLLRATVDFFESYGKQRLLQADLDADWVTDFLAFEKREKL
ncbi:acyl-CoA dehydrogenase, partial [Tsukamurella tyrosinosolvens]